MLSPCRSSSCAIRSRNRSIRNVAGHLPDKSPRIGKPELHRHPPLPLQVRAIMRALQRLLDHPLAALERLFGLEQRRNLDPLLDPEQPRIIERRQQREAGLRLRDQKPDRRLRVDKLDDLRHHHHQPLGRRALFHQRSEADRQRPHPPEQIVDRVEVRSPIRRIVRLRLESHLPPRRVMQLRGVQPHVNMRQPQPMRFAGSRVSPTAPRAPHRRAPLAAPLRSARRSAQSPPTPSRAPPPSRARMPPFAPSRAPPPPAIPADRRTVAAAVASIAPIGSSAAQEIAARRPLQRFRLAAIALDHRELVASRAAIVRVHVMSVRPSWSYPTHDASVTSRGASMVHCSGQCSRATRNAVRWTFSIASCA